MANTSVTIVNAALEQVASQTQITSLADGTPAANAAAVVYAPTVQFLLRVLDPDFARYTITLALSGVAAAPPWTYSYLYPADGLRVRQVRPPVGSYDPNDPQPVRANLATANVAAVQTRVILTNQQNALLVYTTSLVTEGQWDAAFTDAVIRRLANPLAMALSGRPDFAKELLEEASRVAAMAETVDDGMIRP